MDISTLKNSDSAKKFASGEIIAKENDKSNGEMYIVLEGSIGMYENYKQPNENKIESLGTGKFFGESCLFLQKEHSQTAVAESDSILFTVGRSGILEFFQQQPQLTALVMKTLCQRLDELGEKAPEPVAPAAPEGLISDTPPEGFISDTPPPGFISDTPPPGFISDTPPAGPSAPASMPDELFPEGHQIYEMECKPVAQELIYKKNFKCPVCEKAFQAYSVRTTRLKTEKQDKDFRRHYQGIDTTYYEIVTCPECWFSNFEAAYTQPVIARFKENRGQITAYKAQIGLDLTEDHTVNAVFVGYFLALKGAPLFYKNPEMMIAKVWLRLMWLYKDVQDLGMERIAAKNAHAAYLSAFEKTDAGPEAIQQLCVLMGELSLIVKDIPNAKIFFVKARSNRGGSRTLISQAEDGIETIRKIEAGQMRA